jgi:tRNA (guanine37-N1)-methyltransferase
MGGEMRFDIITIFPALFAGFFEHGIVRRAQAEELVSIAVHDLRNFTHDRHRTIDDRPFGGGEGMVLKPEPLAEALESLGIGANAQRRRSKAAEELNVLKGRDFSRATNQAECTSALAQEEGSSPESSAASLAPEGTTRVILLSAQGRAFTQSMARELAQLERVVLLCGRYEGVDERINELYCDMELSIGDYVLSGGELAAAVVLDATMRLVPGVLGNESSGEFESFGVPDAAITTDVDGVPRSQHGSGGLLDYPHYTRPAEFRGLRAPEVLLNGDHQQIRRWRRQQQLRKTLANRPDLLEQATLSPEDRRLLDEIQRSRKD